MISVRWWADESLEEGVATGSGGGADMGAVDTGTGGGGGGGVGVGVGLRRVGALGID